MLTRNDLKHGDVLLFSWWRNQSLYARGIRFVTGSKYVHVAIVQEIEGHLFVLEQQSERMHSLLDLYYAFDGEIIDVVRPTFKVSPFNQVFFERRDYGDLCIIDSFLNHLMNRLTLHHWKFRPIFKTLFRSVNVDCSILLANILDLKNNVSWCYNNDVIEPDDFFNNKEGFEFLGTMSW